MLPRKVFAVVPHFFRSLLLLALGSSLSHTFVQLLASLVTEHALGLLDLRKFTVATVAGKVRAFFVDGVGTVGAWMLTELFTHTPSHCQTQLAWVAWKVELVEGDNVVKGLHMLLPVLVLCESLAFYGIVKRAFL